MSNDKNNLLGVFVLVILVVFAVYIFGARDGGLVRGSAVEKAGYATSKAKTSLEVFARCLALKEVTMYGAYWCPHCQNEKANFGDAFSYVPYVECAKETAKCTAAGIQGFPTWIFPDGRRFEGEQGLEKLSEESGCPLPS